MLVIISFGSFLLNPDDYNDRLQIIIQLFLASAVSTTQLSSNNFDVSHILLGNFICFFFHEISYDIPNKAFLYVAGQSLPQLPYLTVLDKVSECECVWLHPPPFYIFSSWS